MIHFEIIPICIDTTIPPIALLILIYIYIYIYIYIVFCLTIVLAVRFKAWVYGRSRARIAGSNRDGLITRPEKSCVVWYVCVLETSTMWRLRPIRAVEPWKKDYILFKKSKSFMTCTATALLQYVNRRPADCICI